MLRGCLLWVLVYGVVWYAEHQQLRVLALPWVVSTVVATTLALGVTLCLGSLLGLVDVLRRRTQPQTDPAQWQDGQPVRISGRLLPTQAPTVAPISGQPAVYCTYSGQMPDNGDAIASRQAPNWRGMLAVACEIRTDTQRLPVLGIPSLRHLPHTVYRGRPHCVNAARHLAGTSWEVAPHVSQVDLSRLGQTFDAGYAGLPEHLITSAALERLGMTIGQSTEAELLARLEAHDWQFGERLVAPGAEVTLEGTFRASPLGIDIGYNVRQPAHALHLGGAAHTTQRQLGSVMLLSVVLSALTAAAHYLVFAGQGELFRALLSQLNIS